MATGERMAVQPSTFGELSTEDPEVKKLWYSDHRSSTCSHRIVAIAAFFRLVSLKESRCSFLESTNHSQRKKAKEY